MELAEKMLVVVVVVLEMVLSDGIFKGRYYMRTFIGKGENAKKEREGEIGSKLQVKRRE